MDSSNLSTDDTLSVSPSVKPAGKVPVTRMAYYGHAGKILRLHIMNLLMNILTLGIYSFWGKTRIRKYMTSHISISEDRFEYTGTGKELLYGWLKAILIFLPIIIILYIPVVNIIGTVLFLSILSIALYLALRYRLSRTKWRGIRFHLGGSIKEYFLLSLKRTLINIITFGIKIPQSDILLWSYIANHMSYGDLSFSYKGDHTKLRKIHLKTLSVLIVCFLFSFGSMITLVIIDSNQHVSAKIEKQKEINSGSMSGSVTDPVVPNGEYSGTEVNPTSTSQGKSEIPGSMILGFVFFYLGIGLGLLSRIWYQAALWHEKFYGLRLGNLRFKIDITGAGLLKLYIVNILIILITLGIGKPIAAHRTLRYYIQNIRIGGDIKELIAAQKALQEKSGMGDALAADVGFDMGV